MPLASVTVETSREAAEKRPGAFRTISEVSEEIAVPQHVLRFWETKFAQIRPLKRAGGRRYYRPEDVDLLKGVRQLLHGQGYTIRGAQRVMRESGVRFVQAVGRGEAVASAPGPQDLEADAAPVELGGAAADMPAAEGLAAIEEALRELYACRAALEALRNLPDR